MSQFSEYTRLRDIVVKRLKRRGIKAHVPTVKEIKLAGGGDLNIAIELKIQTEKLQNYIYRTDLLREEKKAKRPKYTEEEKKARRREYERQYRRRKVAREQERPEHPNKYQGYLKGLRTMGVDIPPSKLPSFFKYMDYRMSQGNTARKYVFDIFVDDFQKLLNKGYKPDEILADFQQFEADMLALQERMGKMSGMSVEQAIVLWDKFIVNG